MTRLIALLSRKEKPFAYIDTHAGLGLYDLHADQADRTKEYQQGIGLLLQQTDLPLLLSDYLQVIAAINTPSSLCFYPGSPMLAKHLMRVSDRIILNEKHPDDGQQLKQHMLDDPRIAIHMTDGWLLPKALLPVKEKRALLLIDPPFEQDHEPTLCVQAMQQAIHRMRQCVVAVWYPIKNANSLKPFYQQMQNTHAPKLLKVELMIKPADNALGLNGSGMIIANPPWGLEKELTSILPYLTDILASSRGSWNLDWLINDNM